ncbi:prepilin-type N-terminal cleavage/methylation domain-containing protein [Methylobacter sp. YRD-M1]|uniref:prepilin-type N-terminal cleavage/methylation domain-containing protein n=1 Tax=Methylobacter sp. YRD-M1 TaxID=2911520 RepID=UPI00227D44C9|nr:prepilin-type N-terminal cleavage/methylation domain-containing protein [Methylobacter sp. YRD-M1]WAK03274.1 prepilin-type N-terminal cleavage/methylation domain-containing protein [Methylobacter sp. YRD-M1]
MNKTPPTLAQGFTLIEMTVVLLLITLLASVAIRETNSLSFQVRYEQTQERLERIREAILGNPRQIINGQQAVSGFVADMGRLPGSIKELIQLSSYCSDATKLTKADCENTLDAIWFGRKSYGFCNLNFPNETQCLANSGSWTHLFYGGWNGPYLNISGNPTDSYAFTDGWGRPAQGYCSDITYTNETACVAPAIWAPPANDNNYGWYYDTATYANGLRIQSYGKDHVYAGSDYDADYPALETQPAVKSQDWQVDISGGISISLIKPYNPHPTVSRCSDPEKSTKNTCTPPETWYGGCDKAGYINKMSCENPSVSGSWSKCSDGTSVDRATCGTNYWYGEGYGCPDPSKTTETDCGPLVWQSCTDGTNTEKNVCESNNEIWFGKTIYTIPSSGPYSTYSSKNICMAIFYRKSDSSIGVLINDEDTTNDTPVVIINPKPVIADGSAQTIRFSNFRDSITNNLVSSIPIGINAIGIYEYDGDCDPMNNPLYPADRKKPIQVVFHQRADLPIINW